VNQPDKGKRKIRKIHLLRAHANSSCTSTRRALTGLRGMGIPSLSTSKGKTRSINE